MQWHRSARYHHTYIHILYTALAWGLLKNIILFSTFTYLLYGEMLDVIYRPVLFFYRWLCFAIFDQIWLLWCSMQVYASNHWYIHVYTMFVCGKVTMIYCCCIVIKSSFVLCINEGCLGINFVGPTAMQYYNYNTLCVHACPCLVDYTQVWVSRESLAIL